MMRQTFSGPAHAIIAGTAKAATSSVFGYLSSHPEICGSSIKETAFFLNSYSGNHADAMKQYLKYFTHCKPDAKFFLEASPGYLAHGSVVAGRIRELIPDARLLFMLRDPVDRLYSYYHFHTTQLTGDFDTSLSFEEFVDLCMGFASGHAPISKTTMNVRHFRALEIGRYAEYLKEFFQLFPRERIHVLYYEHLNDDVRGSLSRLCAFLGVDHRFYDTYQFKRVNVTFSARIKPLHVLALAVNRSLERYLRQRPHIKSKLVDLYSQFNRKRAGYPPMPDPLRGRLLEFYRESNRALAALLDGEENASWVG
jgi:hypothetical protein